jgi:hypothetical protein
MAASRDALKAISMAHIPSLADHLAPNTIRQLEQAAERRYEEGECLKKQNRLLSAVYLYGYSVEMCLAAAYFRSAGFHVTEILDDDLRHRRMAQARQLHLMSNDPHPLDGWARFLEWQRCASGTLPSPELNRLREALQKAEQVYKHWRPQLRYKVTCVAMGQVNEVRQCVR